MGDGSAALPIRDANVGPLGGVTRGGVRRHHRPAGAPHLEWSGERAADDKFKLLTLEGAELTASIGSTFSSTGANFNGTFHDRSVVAELR